MTLGRILAFLAGAAGLVALTVYAGAGAVVQALTALRFSGLLLIAVVHLPVIGLMGLAWWQIGHDFPGATRLKFAWARLVRDSAAEVLPFSQLGGFVLGVRALHLSGVRALRAALSMSVDLVMELCAKLPYFMAGLIVLLATAPRLRLSHALPAALALTVVVVALPLIFRRGLRRGLESAAAAIARRWPSLNSGEETRAFFDRTFRERRRLFAAFAIHLLCWLIGAAETWLILALMGVRVGATEALTIDSLVVGLRTFAFLIPAAAGVQEASYVLVCALFGLTPATAIALSLARRARDLLIGVPTLAGWQFLEAHASGAPTTIDS
jgi:glycosyltransferase 2 family protein